MAKAPHNSVESPNPHVADPEPPRHRAATRDTPPDYNYLDGVYYTLESPPLPEGATELKFNFIKNGEFAGTGELYVGGEKVAETEMPKMHISTYSLAETFDVGRDTGTQVSKRYSGPFPFTGKLDKVVIALTD